jgi:hypothetical protein
MEAGAFSKISINFYQKRSFLFSETSKPALRALISPIQLHDLVPNTA